MSAAHAAARQQAVLLDARGIHWAATPLRAPEHVPWERVLALLPPAVVVYRDETGRVRRRPIGVTLIEDARAALRARLELEIRRTGKLERTWSGRRPFQRSPVVESVPALLGPIALAAVFGVKLHGVVGDAGAMAWPLLAALAIVPILVGALAWRAWQLRASAGWTGWRIDARGLSCRDARGHWRRLPARPGDRSATLRTWGGVHLDFRPSGPFGLEADMAAALLSGLARRWGLRRDDDRTLARIAVRCLVAWPVATAAAVATWGLGAELDRELLVRVTLGCALFWPLLGTVMLWAAGVERAAREKRSSEADALLRRLRW